MQKKQLEKLINENTDGVYITQHLKKDGGCGKWFPHLMLFENVYCIWCGKSMDVFGHTVDRSKMVIDFNH